jgi:hypothetical protein
MSRKHSLLYLLGILLVLLTACGGGDQGQTTTTAPDPGPSLPPPTTNTSALTVGTIQLGKSIGPDKKVTAPSETFGKTDTIYASVDTSGSGSGMLKARWTFQQGGKIVVVNEETHSITPTGPATTEFHIQKPDGWPAGDYQLEVFLDDRSMGVKTFKVA